MNATTKKAISLGKKLVSERTRFVKETGKIGAVLLTTDTIIGGYKMIQKLRKQKKLFEDVSKVLEDRIKILENFSTDVVETK